MPDTEFQLPSISAEAALDRPDAVLVDLRKPAAAAADGRALPGAAIRDPFALRHDDPLMSDPRPMIVFCVHGHEVSQFGCAMMLLHGRDARYVRGGFAALVAAGAPTEELC